MKKRWLGLGLALLIGTSVAVSDFGMASVSATGTSNTTGGQTSTGTANTTAYSTANNATFTVDGAEVVVTENLNPNKYPKDFTETKVTCKGKEYKGLKANFAEMELICLLNRQTGRAAYYIYRDEDQSVYPLIRIESGSDYIIAMPEYMMEGTTVPEGYTKTEVEFEKGKAQAYQSEGAGAYLIYAMDSTGEKSWYEYQQESNSYQKYVQETEPEETVTGETETAGEVSDVSADLSKQYEELHKELEQTKSKYRIIIATLLIVIAILLILFVNTLLKGTRYKDNDCEEDYEDDDYEEEDYENIRDYDYEEEEEDLETPRKEERKDFREETASGKKWFSGRGFAKIDEEAELEETYKEKPVQRKTEEKPEKKYKNDIEILDLNDL